MKTRQLIVQLTIAAILSSCTLTRHRDVLHSDSLHSEGMVKSSRSGEYTGLQERALIETSASADNTWLLEIRPQGSFTFSRDAGFKGAAASLKFSGSGSSTQVMNEIINRQKETVNARAADSFSFSADRSASLSKATVSSKKTPGFAYLLLIAVLLAAFALPIVRNRMGIPGILKRLTGTN